MKPVELKAPAKINLYLKVLRKRPDSYHDIETIFERIDLCDDIRLRPLREGIVILCDDPQVPCDSRNLVHKAARLLKDKYSVEEGVEIHIGKKIPVAAGLGGASSDCASCLIGLNKLWKLNLSRDELLSLGSAIGADVAFFLLETGRALGRGKGEILEIAPKGEGFWYVLINPGFAVLAKDAYSALNLGLTPVADDSKIDTIRLGEIKFKTLADLLFNSLETPVEDNFKEISFMKSALAKAGITLTLMSGSGPTIFGVASSKEEALKARDRLLLREGWRAFVAATLW